MRGVSAYIRGNDRRRVDSDHRVLARGGIGPLYNFVRFDQAIELRQLQRASIPLKRGETARFALPTGINSEEAQLIRFYLDSVPRCSSLCSSICYRPGF